MQSCGHRPCDFHGDIITDVFTLDAPTEILDYLADPLCALRDAFDDGVSYAALTMEGRPSDPYLWAHLARYQAFHFLSSQNRIGWELVRLPNSGIQVTKGPLVARALKRLGDGPPPPGHSGARRGFYGQRALPLIWNGALTPEAGANLIVDWNADPKTHEVTLALSKPLGQWRFQGVPKLEWRVFVDFSDDGHPGFITSDEPLDGSIFDPAELDSDDQAAG